MNRYVRIGSIIGLLSLLFVSFQNATVSAVADISTLPDPNGIVGYWSFDGRQNSAIPGNSIASASRGPHAQTNNDNGKGLGLIPSPAKTALLFDGIDDNLSIAYDAKLAPEKITISVLINPSSLDKEQFIISKMESSGYGLTIKEGYLRFIVSVDGTYTQAKVSVKQLVVGHWQNIVGSYDGEALRLYVNGTIVDKVVAPGRIYYAYKNSLCIGRDVVTTGCRGHENALFKGALDELIIWNRPLSMKSIRDLASSFPNALAASCLASKNRSHFKFMSYNIKAGESAMGTLETVLTPAQEEQNLEAVAKVIAEENPAVVILQEVDYFNKIRNTRDQSNWLATRLGYKYSVYVSNSGVLVRPGDKAKNFFGNAILSKYPILSYEAAALPKMEGPGIPAESKRSLGKVQIELAKGRPLDVWFTHLSVSTGESRRNQLLNIAEQMSARQNPGVPLIFGGDLNNDENWAAPIAKENAGIIRQWMKLYSCKANCAKTTLSEKSDVDHIAYREGFSAQTIMWDYRAVQNLTASDHKPITAQFCIGSF